MNFVIFKNKFFHCLHQSFVPLSKFKFLRNVKTSFELKFWHKNNFNPWILYIHLLSVVYTHDVAKSEEKILKEKRKRIKTGDFLVAFSSTSHMIFLFLKKSAYQRASCLYDMIPFLFLFIHQDPMARAYNISQYIHARCACTEWDVEWEEFFLYCIFHPADFEKCTQLFFWCVHIQCAEGEKKQKK